MPRKEIYAKYTEEQKQAERNRAKQWHKANYEKIKTRKQQQAKLLITLADKQLILNK